MKRDYISLYANAVIQCIVNCYSIRKTIDKSVKNIDIRQYTEIQFVGKRCLNRVVQHYLTKTDKCSTSCCHTDITQSCNNILLLTLFDGMKSLLIPKKLCKSIPIEKLEMGDKVYKANCAIFHDDKDAATGHYTFLIRKDKSWINANDHIVQKKTWPRNSKKFHYILYYLHKEILKMYLCHILQKALRFQKKHFRVKNNGKWKGLFLVVTNVSVNTLLIEKINEFVTVKISKQFQTFIFSKVFPEKHFGASCEVGEEIEIAGNNKIVLNKVSQFVIYVLRAQIKGLNDLMNEENSDTFMIKLRMRRVEQKYYTYEEINDELVLLDPDRDHDEMFNAIQSEFYSLASRVENYLENTNLSSANPSTNSSVDRDRESNENESDKKSQRIKLPKITLPTFDGKFEHWLTFKTRFREMIDAQKELSDANKLHYLKSALIGDAAKKVDILTLSDINYKKAWEMLTRAYEIKRLLVTQHFKSIYELPVIDKETTKGLMKIADDMQQHIVALDMLGVHFAPENGIYIIETKLPKNILRDWEATLDRNETPSLEKMYEFLYKTAACASKRDHAKIESEKLNLEVPNKKRRFNSSNRVFVSNASKNCPACKGNLHPLFKCDKFKELTAEKRLELIKNARLCYNCLRLHRGKPLKQVRKAEFSIQHSLEYQLITTALIRVKTNNNTSSLCCRALLDTDATANFIAESVLRKLCIRPLQCEMPVNTINNVSITTKGIIQLNLQSTDGTFSKNITCLSVPKIADSIPGNCIPRNLVPIPANIKLADPEFHLSRPIDLIIGAGVTLSLFMIGQINLTPDNKNDLYLQKTRLGWYHSCLRKTLNKFWDVEEVSAHELELSEFDECEKYFLKTIQRDESGRYTVRLPFRDTNEYIGDSKFEATKRLYSLEAKLKSNPELKGEYTKILNEYLTLGHMSLVENATERGYYMPHHAVAKDSSNTTKTRIVFNASMKTKRGVSLNDALMAGPTIQEPLIMHLIRFRMYKFVMTADIEKMYRQVLVHRDDRRYQRLLWRPEQTINTYELNTLVFGITSSPFLAIRTLKKLAENERLKYPIAADIIKNHLYVDYLITGAKTIEEARNIRNEVRILLERGGFVIRQWAANDKRIIQDLPTESKHKIFTFKTDPILMTLGIAWDSQVDCIQYQPEPITCRKQPTKRRILSEISKIYDPVGLLGPVIFYIKKLMQDIWKTGIHWDESIPQEIYCRWTKFTDQWANVGKIHFKRRVIADNHKNLQVHGFCEVSSHGYGACIYVRSEEYSGKITSHLLCAKSKIAPLKIMTIPRLELCGAVILVRLYEEVARNHDINNIEKTFFWTDSTIVLHWLRTSPALLKTFVMNRVAMIQEHTQGSEWRHIRSEENPADAISRGQLPFEFLKNNLWPHGPKWLLEVETNWPRVFPNQLEMPELRKNTCLSLCVDNAQIFERFSSFNKLLMVIAYCLRFKRNNKYVASIKPQELNEAEICIMKVIQSSQYADKIIALKNLPYKGKLLNLSPFIDEHGLIRVGGRLRQANIPFHQKHPILIPSRHHVSDCIIRDLHETNHHTGIATTLYNLRQKYWIPDGRNQIRKIIRNCVRCRRFSINPVNYKMGELPTSRVQPSMPFSHTGLDFCGPFYLKEKKYRNRNKIKVYVCVFICMTIKAVHLEVVSDLSTEGFIAALRRFIARRGIPEHLYSDNGTNFVGANSQLKEMYALLNSEEQQININRFASEQRNTLLTFEEFYTFTTEIEGILNSRPIIAISSDPNDILALTPAHYLISKPITTLPESNLTEIPSNRLSIWQHISKMRQDFWIRWNKEYLNELQT
ncbi:uncharacterized protein [Prorops nasuta]|uniref:uncharacterized protein n=1 Tax=Prorops nasuta TaxID=863751 RepID=UPI0034CD3E8A